jgi:hypothetical protein
MAGEGDGIPRHELRCPLSLLNTAIDALESHTHDDAFARIPPGHTRPICDWDLEGVVQSLRLAAEFLQEGYSPGSTRLAKLAEASPEGGA